jgi:dihydrofolate reductase
VQVRNPGADPVMGSAVAAIMANTGALLLGRRTYEDFYSFWPPPNRQPLHRGAGQHVEKYVASTTLREPLPWQNSTLLKGNAAQAVAGLRQQPGKDIVVLGSGALV